MVNFIKVDCIDNMDKNNSSINEPRAYKRERQKGERWDGYVVKDIAYFQKLMPYLMKTRTGSSIYFKESFDATKVVEYLNEKNKDLAINNLSICKKQQNRTDDGENINSSDNSKENINYSYNHFFMTALTRVIASRPHLNRFVAGKKIYQRHDIELAYVIKKQLTDEGEETVTVSSFERDSNIDDVINVLTPAIKGVKKDTKDDHGDFLAIFIKFPSLIISFVVMLMNFFVVIGYAPKFLRKMDIMQCSAFVSNLGSVDLKNVPLHHLYDRGTCSIFVVIGKVRKINNENEPYKKYEVDVSVVFDERVADGVYMINSLKLLQEIFDNPKQLDERLKEVPIDI